jgi:hypothetical protein
MGDRCWVQVMVHKAHHDKFMEVTEGYFQHEYEEQETEGDAIVIQDGQVNYGGYDQLQIAAEAGLTFSVISGAGGGYGPSACVGIGRKFYVSDTDHESYPVVRCSKDGIHEGELASVKAFLLAHEAVSKELGIHQKEEPDGQ